MANNATTDERQSSFDRNRAKAMERFDKFLSTILRREYTGEAAFVMSIKEGGIMTIKLKRDEVG